MMTRYDEPPFEPADLDRIEIWRMLVSRDTDAYLNADWEAVRSDFIVESFYGIDARKRSSPDNWRIAFPTLEQYQHEWLRQAHATARTVDTAHAREAFFAAVTLVDIQITGDFAVAHKKFLGALPNRDGTEERLQWRTVYVCQRHHGRWKIASFIGYLPYDDPGASATLTGHFVPPSSQHATAGPYSPVIGVRADAQIFVISGQAPLDSAGRVIGTDIETQSRATLENCRTQLRAAGCDLETVFKATVYLTDLANWQAFNAVYREFLRPPYPARTAVQAGLLPGFLVEVEMWACRR